MSLHWRLAPPLDVRPVAAWFLHQRKQPPGDGVDDADGDADGDGQGAQQHSSCCVLSFHQKLYNYTFCTEMGSGTELVLPAEFARKSLRWMFHRFCVFAMLLLEVTAMVEGEGGLFCHPCYTKDRQVAKKKQQPLDFKSVPGSLQVARSWRHISNQGRCRELPEVWRGCLPCREGSFCHQEHHQ